MPAQTIQKFDDLERFQTVQKAQMNMLFEMHRNLSEIAKCDVSVRGCLQMKRIAEKSLVSVQKLANQMEVVKCLN